VKDSFWRVPTPGRGELRRFGLLMGVAALVIALYVWYRGGSTAVWWLAGIAAFFLAAGLILPVGLKSVYVPWMFLARLLGFVNTHVLLALVFYTLFTLMGAILRIFRYDPLDRKLSPKQKSYWLRRSSPLLSKDHYEKQF